MLKVKKFKMLKVKKTQLNQIPIMITYTLSTQKWVDSVLCMTSRILVISL